MKLNLGSGTKPCPLPGTWTNVDIKKGPIVHITEDFNKPKWKFKSDSIEEIFMHHCLEHLKEPDTVLREIYRIAKPGARIEIHVPHFTGQINPSPSHRWQFGIHAFDEWSDILEVSQRKILYFACEVKGWRRALSLPIQFLINLSPQFFERFWHNYVGGADEIIYVLRPKK